MSIPEDEGTKVGIPMCLYDQKLGSDTEPEERMKQPGVCIPVVPACDRRRVQVRNDVIGKHA